jgi:hypothetical protein
MLIPLVDIPVSSEISDAKTLALCDFVSHIGILGTVLIRPPSGVSQESESAALETLSKAIGQAGCYVEGLSIDDDDLATQLLDKGTHIVYFTNSEEKELQKKVLKSLTRARVGVSVMDAVASVDSMQNVIDEYREYAGHFLFR